jgi:glycine/D-amino acid oxidase-like deaminating enzyme/nitrite reductase/ring-hydroxylating ferredoxin subunit
MDGFKSEPLWDDATLPRFGALERDLVVDVAIVGAGLTGITTALLLKNAGYRVALLERRTVAGGDTGCTTAHLTAVVDLDLPRLARTFGRSHAQAVWDAGFAAIDQIESLVADYDIECDFIRVPGFRHVPFDAADENVDKFVHALYEEADLARELGFFVEPVARTPLVDRPGWQLDDQALFHPRKYLKRLVGEIPGNGSIVCEHSEVAFTDDRGVISCNGHTVRADNVVIATHSPLGGRLSTPVSLMLQSEVALYTTYAAAMDLPKSEGLAPAAYWDLCDPYRYVRVHQSGDRVWIVAGGEDHKTGQEPDTTERFAALDRWFTGLVPTGAITNRWSGQVIETADGLPLIGEVVAGQYLATGFAGNGMTFGTLAAMMIRDALAGVQNPWRDLFDVTRSAIARGPIDYLKENADYPYYRIRDSFAGGSRAGLRSLPRGEGRLVELNDRVVAASRDDRGQVTLLSPVCTHLGCRVAWNQAERTWDCPCHGSRFSATGEVLAGPAEQPLERVAFSQEPSSRSRTTA